MVHAFNQSMLHLVMVGVQLVWLFLYSCWVGALSDAVCTSWKLKWTACFMHLPLTLRAKQQHSRAHGWQQFRVPALLLLMLLPCSSNHVTYF
jgi:hypothetical protein